MHTKPLPNRSDFSTINQTFTRVESSSHEFGLKFAPDGYFTLRFDTFRPVSPTACSSSAGSVVQL